MRSVLLVALLALLPGRAAAALLDLSSLSPGRNAGTQFVLPGATVTVLDGEALYLGSITDSLFETAGGPGFCGGPLSSDGATVCTASLRIDFADPVTSLAFEIGTLPSPEGAPIDGFTSLTTCSGPGDCLTLYGDGVFSWNDLGANAVTSLLIGPDQQVGAALREFRFETAPVPLPGALPLFATTLGAGIVLCRTGRRRAGRSGSVRQPAGI